MKRSSRMAGVGSHAGRKALKVRIDDANSPNGFRELDADAIYDSTSDQPTHLEIHLGDSIVVHDMSHPKFVSFRRATEHQPPERAEWFAHLLLPQHHREHMLGDLEEEFRTIILPKFGLRHARFWYWWQVSRSIAALFVPRLKRVALWGGAAEFLRRWL